MWNMPILDTDAYHVIMWFIMYSILGWFLESVYMSFCNKRITNRGFVKGPFCPIYGIGFVGAWFMFRPIASHHVLLYITAAIIATAFEYAVGELMIKIFGELWWDYNEKPFNYKGIICLESTLGWGFYALCLFGFVHRHVAALADSIAPTMGRKFCSIIFIIFALDFCTQLARALHISESERFIKMKDRYTKLRAKFYDEEN
ncbi:MAG: putative ABC transporter permease [Lachnospiraceae bacterium]|nr:putative ABC transporter permease [Lachnospiraceae bacterium]